MRVMLTGASGNIGRVAAHVLAREHDLMCVDVAPPTDPLPGAFAAADLTRPSELDAVAGDLDCIVHLAAIPNPYVGSWDEVLRVNLLSTFNVLRLAAERRIPRVVFGSSESASGWGIHGQWYQPDYLPIDEKHRSLPSEVYSYTKAFGDQLCQGFSREHDVRTVCLRYTFVTFPANYPGWFAALRAPGPRDAIGTFYAWIDVADVAEAIACAVRVPMTVGQSETFYLTAAEHYGTQSSLEMIRSNWADSVRTDDAYFAANARATLFDIRKARTMLGWSPQWTAERVLNTHG